MKKVLISLVLIMLIGMAIFSQQTGEEFYVYDRENKFYLLMPVSEVYRILGNPEEVQTIKSPNSTHNYDTVILNYSGILFIYHAFLSDPKVLVIGFSDVGMSLGNLNVIGLNSDEILKKYGDPDFTRTRNECVLFLYEFSLRMPNHLVLQFQFNISGICDGVMLTHSDYFI